MQDRATIFHGDDTGAELRFVHEYGGSLNYFHDVRELLEFIRTNSNQVTINPRSLSHLLHHGFVPFPFTVFTEVMTLGIGDSLSQHDRDGFQYTSRSPYWQTESRHEAAPSQHLSRLLASAVSKVVDTRSTTLLMSSGKDSVALAIAIAEIGCGHRVRAVTYVDSQGEQDATNAESIAAELGLRHATVTIPPARIADGQFLNAVFASMPMPSVDFAYLPYAALLFYATEPGCQIIDGGGNDTLFGIVPSQRALARIQWAELLPRCLGAAFPFYRRASALGQSPPEVLMPSRMLRYQDTKSLLVSAVDTHRVWRDWYRTRGRSMSPIDMATFVRGKHLVNAKDILKVRLAANSLGRELALPWTDTDIAEYCAGLPREQRVDLLSGTNKIVLRQMLAEKLGQQSHLVGKQPFGFDGRSFLIENRGVVFDYIAGCRFFGDTTRRLKMWYDHLSHGLDTSQAIMTLFLLALWEKHFVQACGIAVMDRKPSVNGDEVIW